MAAPPRQSLGIDLPEASPLIIADTLDHIVIAFEISKTNLRRHRRFVEQLCDIIRRSDPEPLSADRRVSKDDAPHDAKEEGRLAHRAGVPPTANPYRTEKGDERSAEEWDEGWLSADVLEEP